MSMKNSRQYDYEKQQQKTASAAINVAQLVKIIAYDPAKMTVDVQPISKRLDQLREPTAHLERAHLLPARRRLCHARELQAR